MKFFLRLMIILIFALMTGTNRPTAAYFQGGCDRPPVHSLAGVDDLENDPDAWGVFCDNSVPTWDMVMVHTPTPSTDNIALRCSITGGDDYGKLHCYRNFDSEPNAVMFSGDFRFKFSPTTCNNKNGITSIIQGLEFTFSRWVGGMRHEFALQWENVTDGSPNDHAPQWRYWDGLVWTPFEVPIEQCLTGSLNASATNWHSLRLEGVIANNKVEYRSFTIDSVEHVLTIAVDAVPDAQTDHMAIALQLDANKYHDTYDVLLDDVSFVRWDDLLVPIAPASGSLSSTNQPTFSWNSIANAVQYEMQLDVNDPPSKTVMKADATHYTPSTPLLSQTYHWRVRAIDAAGHASPWTQSQCVTITPQEGQAAARNYYTTSTPTFTWTPISWATSYEVQIDEDRRFLSPLPNLDSIPADTLSVTTPQLADCGYYWRVRGHKGNTVGAWSATEYFVVDAP